MDGCHSFSASVCSQRPGGEILCQYTVGAWTVPRGSMVPPALSTEDQTFLPHSCLPHEILPGRWVSQRVSEDELPVTHVLAGVQGACLLELFLRLLDKSGTHSSWNLTWPVSGRMKASARPRTLCASPQGSHIHHLSKFPVGSPETKGGNQ